MGKPVVAGTRLMVELLLERLVARESLDEILAAQKDGTKPGDQIG